MGEKRFSGVSFLMNLVFPPRCRCCQQLSGSKLLCEACATGLHEVGEILADSAEETQIAAGVTTAKIFCLSGRSAPIITKEPVARFCKILSSRGTGLATIRFYRGVFWSGQPVLLAGFLLIISSRCRCMNGKKTGSTKRCTWPGPCREKWGFRAGRICCGKFKKHHRSICKKQRTVAKM